MPTLTQLGATAGFTSGDLNCDGWIAVVASGQKLYFADGRPYSATIGDSGYHKLDFRNTSLVGEVTGTFTQGEVVTQATSDAAGIFDESVGTGATTKNLVYRTTTTEFNATNEVTGADSGATVTPTSVVAPPHWLNWVLTTGDFPDGGSNAMVLSSGAIWMNSMYNPNQFFHTRQQDPLDLDTSQDDEAAAYYSQAEYADIVGDAIICFIALKDYYTVIGCANSVWVVRGGLPRQGGATANLTYEVGIFSPSAYCFDDKDNLYWVSLAGFHILTKDALVSAGAPENLTLFIAPDLFQTLALNRRTDRVVCKYDKKRHGINVCVSMLDGQWHYAWFYDILHESFLPDEFADSTFPTSLLYLDSYRGDYRGLLVAGYDGYVRNFDEDTKDDDGTAMGSYCLYGPIDLHHWTRGQGSIKEVEVTLSEGSDQINWSIYTGKSYEEVYDDIIADNTAFTSGTFTGGGVHTIYEKIAGRYLGILFDNATAAKTWEIESVKVRVTERGRSK